MARYGHGYNHTPLAVAGPLTDRNSYSSLFVLLLIKIVDVTVSPAVELL